MVKVEDLEQRVAELRASLAERNDHIDSLLKKARARLGDVAGFERENHVNYVLDFWRKGEETKDSFEMLAMEHIRVQGVFWALGSLQILESEDQVDRNAIVEWVLECQDKATGGFGGNVGHDTNLINTQFAVYVLAQCDALDWLDADKVASYVAARQREDGAFEDEWSNECDTRYTCCALFTLRLVNRLDAVNLQAAKEYVLRCRNSSDGAFGQIPGAESHAAFTYTALGALQVAEYHFSNQEADDLAWWLCERQCDSGGLNGRPEKQADVCYSFWALTCLRILGRTNWLDGDRLASFILQCQDSEAGGIADRPGNVSDLFHTFFGLCGLDLLHKVSSNAQIHPIFALPNACLAHSG
mmetsp:Transcript_251/g.330  ORF Transcript_251/g.330 Transcript_251/m.330 type:complete len:357 (-) Transcript_251:209-1279(-)